MKYYKAVYTVEASLIFPICIIIICSVLCLTFSIYRESCSYIDEHIPKEVDYAEEFRRIQMITDLIPGKEETNGPDATDQL